jgi:hypothetical protein
MTYRCITLVVLAGLAGCAGRPTLLPPSDPNLRKTAAQFSADAAKRHPYKADAPRGEAASRAEVDYMFHHINLVNLSADDWADVELWINQKYVVFLPQLPHNQQKTVGFTMIFDDKGAWLGMTNDERRVEKIEAYMNGKMYEIPCRLAD